MTLKSSTNITLSGTVLAMKLGAQIRAVREAKGLSEDQLAKLIGDDVSYVRCVEGDQMLPDEKLCRALELDYRELQGLARTSAAVVSWPV